MWRDTWLIARHDLRRMLLARETLLWTFAMPVIFFYFLGTVTGGFGTPDPDRPDPIALRGADRGGFLVDELTRRLEEQSFAVATPASDEEAERYARRLTLPGPAAGHDDLTASVIAGNQATLTFDRRGDDLNRQYDQLRVGRAVYTVLADLAAASVLDGGASPETFAALEAAPRTVTLAVSSAGRREDPPTGYAQAIPGTMVMFTMLVLMTSGGITLVIERKQGLLRRLASTPIRPASVVAGKWTARMALGVVQIGFAMLVGRVLFQMDWGAAVGMVGRPTRAAPPEVEGRDASRLLCPTDPNHGEPRPAGGAQLGHRKGAARRTFRQPPTGAAFLLLQQAASGAAPSV